MGVGGLLGDVSMGRREGSAGGRVSSGGCADGLGGASPGSREPPPTDRAAVARSRDQLFACDAGPASFGPRVSGPRLTWRRTGVCTEGLLRIQPRLSPPFRRAGRRPGAGLGRSPVEVGRAYATRRGLSSTGLGRRSGNPDRGPWESLRGACGEQPEGLTWDSIPRALSWVIPWRPLRAQEGGCLRPRLAPAQAIAARRPR